MMESGLFLKPEAKAQPMRRLLGRRSHQRAGGGKYNIKLRAPKMYAFRNDPYHYMLALPFFKLLGGFISVYVTLWILFAPLYMSISDSCDLDSHTFQSAVYYSLITMSTIGFGTPDMRFNRCWSAMVVIMVQTLIGTVGASLAMITGRRDVLLSPQSSDSRLSDRGRRLSPRSCARARALPSNHTARARPPTVNAVLVGTLYSKIARSKNRGARVVFSERACIRRVRGNLYFSFQVRGVRRASPPSAAPRARARPASPLLPAPRRRRDAAGSHASPLVDARLVAARFAAPLVCVGARGTGAVIYMDGMCLCAGLRRVLGALERPADRVAHPLLRDSHRRRR